MIMDTLDTLPNQHHHHHHHHHHHSSAFLLTESAAAAAVHHFNVLSFDTCLYKSGATSSSGGSPIPASICTPTDDPAPSEAQPGDLNTPVTTSGDIPSFFGPSTVVEPPPITGSLDPEELSIEQQQQQQHSSPHHSPTSSQITERATPQDSALSPSLREEENTNHSTLSMYPHSSNNNMAKLQHRSVYTSAGSPNIAGNIQMQNTSPLGLNSQSMGHSPSAVNQWLLSSGDKPMYPSMFGLLQGTSQSPQQQYPSATPSPAGTQYDDRSQAEQLMLSMECTTNLALKQPPSYPSCSATSTSLQLDMQQQQDLVYSRVGQPLVTGTAKYQWDTQDYGSSQNTGGLVVPGPSSLVPKQEPFSAACGGDLGQSTSGAGYGVQLAEYNPSTSKGHEILSQVYQQSPVPLKLVPVHLKQRMKKENKLGASGASQTSSSASSSGQAASQSSQGHHHHLHPHQQVGSHLHQSHTVTSEEGLSLPVVTSTL
ncbi:hypothetical protein NQ315_005252 [Exocentrus adspersus]|uniref:Uncharacterized protein n=1 Tax=Exocentrus adspersus TaxID=1586481 RepID=A0AAV8W1B9_9CUCU|nr:hypothetical protein NQ315_005252 [Exocentrus adspersus]